MIVIYVPCADADEAKKIGDFVMKKRLAPCCNIIGGTYSAAFWPPKTGAIEAVSGAVLLIKSVDGKYDQIESEVKKLHSDTNPCIFSLPVSHVSQEYSDWMRSEIH